MWLPAVEWYYSERVRQLTYGDGHGVKDADGAVLSDEAVREAADFGIFIDLASIPQKENDARTAIEDGLFRHALGATLQPHVSLIPHRSSLTTLLIPPPLYTTLIPRVIVPLPSYSVAAHCGSCVRRSRRQPRRDLLTREHGEPALDAPARGRRHLARIRRPRLGASPSLHDRTTCRPRTRTQAPSDRRESE